MLRRLFDLTWLILNLCWRVLVLMPAIVLMMLWMMLFDLHLGFVLVWLTVKQFVYLRLMHSYLLFDLQMAIL
jgi:hypothetical protein